jgi:hypothetical protein
LFLRLESPASLLAALRFGREDARNGDGGKTGAQSADDATATDCFWFIHESSSPMRRGSDAREK